MRIIKIIMIIFVMHSLVYSNNEDSIYVDYCIPYECREPLMFLVKRYKNLDFSSFNMPDTLICPGGRINRGLSIPSFKIADKIIGIGYSTMTSEPSDYIWSPLRDVLERMTKDYPPTELSITNEIKEILLSSENIILKTPVSIHLRCSPNLDTTTYRFNNVCIRIIGKCK